MTRRRRPLSPIATPPSGIDRSKRSGVASIEHPAACAVCSAGGVLQRPLPILPFLYYPFLLVVFPYPAAYRPRILYGAVHRWNDVINRSFLNHWGKLVSSTTPRGTDRRRPHSLRG